MIVLTLVVGQVADRYDRASSPCSVRSCKAAAAATLPRQPGGWQSKTSILAIVALVGAARAFESPDHDRLVPEVVPRPRHRAGAMAWVVSANQTAQIVGPALGGFLYALGPARPTRPPARCSCSPGVCAAAIRSQRTARARASP